MRVIKKKNTVLHHFSCLGESNHFLHQIKKYTDCKVILSPNLWLEKKPSKSSYKTARDSFVTADKIAVNSFMEIKNLSVMFEVPYQKFVYFPNAINENFNYEVNEKLFRKRISRCRF